MRFTLKTLLAAIAVAAVLCCIFFTLPAIAAIPLLAMIWLLVPPALIAGIVYGRGYGRAFSIGCVATGGVFPILWFYAAISVVSGLSEFYVNEEVAIYVKLAFAATFLLIGASGLTSMAVRWLSLRLAAQPGEPTAQASALTEYSVLQRRISTLPTNPAADEQDGPNDSQRKEH